MQPAEEDANFDKLQAVVNDALKKALGAAEYHKCWGKWAWIRPFGSRVCGLATRISDADYWMPLPERHARAAKVIRAYCSVATLSFAQKSFERRLPWGGATFRGPGNPADKFRFVIAPEQYAHQFLINRCLARPAAIRDAPENNTLSWTFSRDDIMHASLNVSYDSGSMLEVTEILRDYYATRPELCRFATALATTFARTCERRGQI